MKIHTSHRGGMTFIEISITTGIVGVVGLIIYALLNVGTILGAKNSAVNTAHQQARVAMIEMIQDLHSAVSLPTLLDVSGTQAGGISFQQWGSVPVNGVVKPNGGPHQIKADANAGQRVVRIVVTSGQPNPIAGQRLVVPAHQIEDDITAVTGTSSDLSLTLANNLPVAIKGAATDSNIGSVICYITDRCAYNVSMVTAGPPAEYKLVWTPRWPGFPDATKKVGSRDIVQGITNSRPFSIPATPAGALYYRFVAAVDLSTSDSKYSRRGYKAANILLNGQVPFKARLTTYQ